jgi:hypothetical protein
VITGKEIGGLRIWSKQDAGEREFWDFEVQEGPRPECAAFTTESIREGLGDIVGEHNWWSILKDTTYLARIYCYGYRFDLRPYMIQLGWVSRWEGYLCHLESYNIYHLTKGPILAKGNHRSHYRGYGHRYKKPIDQI